MANMSLVPKNKPTDASWQPSATIATLQQRAAILKTLRDFFSSRRVLEVETPLLDSSSVTDPYIQSIPAFVSQERHYLQTSPEYAMKRLLAAGSGPIFQICKAFRQEEFGQHHRPEFTLLEWYRPGFTHHDLMNEVDDILQLILKTEPALRKTYADAFKIYLNIDIHQASLTDLAACAQQHDIFVNNVIHDKDTWLQLLMSHHIENKIGQDRPFFIYDFPPSQAALARIESHPDRPPTAARFEVYYKNIELANGFHELQDAEEQLQRFEKNNLTRNALGLETMAIDYNLIAALTHGLPDCAGVALGLDRLVMLATGKTTIADVLSFG